MFIKIFIIFILLISYTFASYDEGKNIFKKKCSSCHKGYIPMKDLKKNFFELDNKLLNLKAPTENLLAYAILDGAKKIGSSDDVDMRQIEIEEYLKSYLEKPDRFNSICYDDVLKYYDNKPSLKGILNEEEYISLSYFFLDYKKYNHSDNGRKNLDKIQDMNKFLQKAKKENKKILVYATAKDCYFCKKMETEVFPLKEVQASINKNFVFIKIDVFEESLAFNLEKEYKKITPSFFFLDNKGVFKKQYPGSWNKNDFLAILKENEK